MNRPTLGLALGLASCVEYDFGKTDKGDEHTGETAEADSGETADTSGVDTDTFQDSAEPTGTCADYATAFNECVGDVCDSKGAEEDCDNTRQWCRESLVGLEIGLDCCDELEECLPEADAKGGPDEECLWQTANSQECCEIADYCAGLTDVSTCYDTYDYAMPENPAEECPQAEVSE